MNEVQRSEIQFDVDGVSLKGILLIPSRANRIVIFSHGSGSSRFSSRNTFVAQRLNEFNIATLLVDLLSPEEEGEEESKFDIPLLTRRLTAITIRLKDDPRFLRFSIGYFGASTGAASALRSASTLGKQIAAIVSRGGRPDLAMKYLPSVLSPTLFIVGGWDEACLGLNELAHQAMHCTRKLIIIPDATHLFEEPGKLELVATYAAEWFDKYLHK